ncbi:MAG: rhomboid family intramembrane serine protease [Bacteroidales bacterium]|nr:rhomboid family intramembrane serine protease [Bacteroidales bacterium]
MQNEKNRLWTSLVIPGFLLLIMWLVLFGEYLLGVDWGNWGVYPMHVSGLPGIILAPFLHEGIKHLAANSLPFLVLGTALFYFYRDLSLKVLLFIWVFTGVWVWFGGRDAYHIGASGIIYGLASFLFLSGVIRKDTRLSAISLIVIFLYGSLIWGAIPNFLPEKNISWESHLGGLAAGIIMAVFYRNSGPQRKKYTWELEEEDEDEEDGYWNSSLTWEQKEKSDSD